MSDQRGDVTKLLKQMQGGSKDAADQLLPLVYEELHRLAIAYFRRERADHTLQPTALVNEAYLKLVDQNMVRWESRGHFMAMAATLMRRILLDYARAHGAEKRGGQKVAIDEGMAVSAQRELDIIALDTALTKLAGIDPDQSRLVELRFFGGLSVEETAEVMGLGTATVKRHWHSAKAWLYREMQEGQASDSRSLETSSGHI
jgi:RNA polymerase sigma factor (TIGR02999 family)